MTERVSCPKIQPAVHTYGLLTTVRKYAGYKDKQDHHHVLADIEIVKSPRAARAIEVASASDPDILDITARECEVSWN